jgi:cobalt/nickel transport system permease protein
MHLAEGILSAPVLGGGAVAAAVGVAIGLRSIQDEHIPRVAVMSAGFFVASLIHVPVGFSSVHLILNGLCGLVLGWAAFPAILLALLLQAVLFGFGGPIALGVNTTIMAAPAVACGLLLRPALRRVRHPLLSPAIGALAGGAAIALSGLLAALALFGSQRAFAPAAALLLGAHVPVMVAEAAITAGAVTFLRRVRPEVLNLPPASRPAGS